MAKIKDFLNFILNIQKEFNKEEIKKRFVLTEEAWLAVLKILIDKKFIVETTIDNYKITDSALVMQGFTIDTLTPLLGQFFSGYENNPAEIGRIGWDTIKNIDKFKVYPGEDLKIYEIHLKGKVIKIEGKDIMDVDIFILKLFETFGIMLPKYKNLNNDWAQIVSYWMQNYGEVVESHQENISVNTEAVDTVISYINHATPSDEYIVKDGFVTYKNGMLYVPTKCIKKLLKREDLFISLRKLAYLMKDYLISGSVPLKVENKSERFWKLNMKKFEIKLEDEIKIEKEPDTGDEDPKNQALLSEPADPVQMAKSLAPVTAPVISQESVDEELEENENEDYEQDD